jgi:2'-5' RNA ligase
LSALQAAVVAAVAGVCDWEPETRRFRAHVTVARMRSGSAPRQRELPPTPSVSFGVEAVVLFRSWLHREGAEYEALVRVGVGSGAEPGLGSGSGSGSGEGGLG